MLTKYKDVRYRKGVKSPSKNALMFAAYSEIFSGRGTKFRHIFKRRPSFFWQNYFDAYLLRIKKAVRGSGPGGMLPRKKFENLHTVVAISVAYFLNNNLSKLRLNFLPLNLSVSTIMVYFVRTFSIMRASRA